MYRELALPPITEQVISECLNEIPIPVNRDFIKSFLLNGQKIVNDIIFTDTITEDEKTSYDLTM